MRLYVSELQKESLHAVVSATNEQLSHQDSMVGRLAHYSTDVKEYICKQVIEFTVEG